MLSDQTKWRGWWDTSVAISDDVCQVSAWRVDHHSNGWFVTVSSSSLQLCDHVLLRFADQQYTADRRQRCRLYPASLLFGCLSILLVQQGKISDRLLIRENTHLTLFVLICDRKRSFIKSYLSPCFLPVYTLTHSIWTLERTRLEWSVSSAHSSLFSCSARLWAQLWVYRGPSLDTSRSSCWHLGIISEIRDQNSKHRISLFSLVLRLLHCRFPLDSLWFPYWRQLCLGKPFPAIAIFKPITIINTRNSFRHQTPSEPC